MTHCVVGSGPAGVACASALLDQGVTVLMLDTGLALDAQRSAMVRALAVTPPADWSRAQLATLKGALPADATGIPLKLSWGSDFPYRNTTSTIPWSADGVATQPSLALGGLSNVWGAAMLPCRDDEIARWPVNAADLADHYRAAIALTGLAARHDDLESLFPLHSDAPETLATSRQGSALLNRLQEHAPALRAQGWTVGHARLAVRARDSARGPGCQYCGLCMHGCPWGCIYNSADTVRRMLENPRFSYRGNTIVRQVEEHGASVVVRAVQQDNDTPLTVDVSRVYLAGGVIPTAQIVLRSQQAFGRPLTLRDSQYFLVPLLLGRATPDVRAEALYTLSQAFIELKHARLGPRSVHLQVYGYSEVVGDAARQSLGPLGRWSRHLEDRLMVVQGYLHSDESSAIEMTLQRDTTSRSGDRLTLTAKINARTRATVGRVVRELLRRNRALGGFVIPPLLQFAQPGRGFHSGGSLPMQRQRASDTSDTLGRPDPWQRVHVVDASVLPDIPATTITLTVMANAHRIASNSAELS